MSTESTQTDSATIARVSVKPPPFWRPNPTLWFAQLEAQFTISGITADITKFNHVVSAVESDILNAVSDLILDPPLEEKYDAIKKRLISIHSESDASKLRTLLQGVELGDQRPSQLLTKMRSLAGTKVVPDDLLKSLWMSHLPPTTQSILAASSDQLSDLAVTADKISEVACVPNPSVVNEVGCNLEVQIAALTNKLSELSQKFERRDRSRGRYNRSPSRSRPRSPPRGRNERFREPENGVCFYHTNFGTRARNCTPPCTFHQEN